MNQAEWIHTALYAGGFLLLFASGELLYHAFKVPVEITRKYVHIITGFICLSFPFVLTSHWSVLILTVSFVFILITSMRLNLLPSINAVKRTTRGSFLFPVVIYICFWVYSIYGQHNFKGSHLAVENFNRFSLGGTVYYFLPILILSVCDPLAALVGKKYRLWPYKIFSDTKTIIGSAAFFISAFILSLIFLIPNCQTFSSALGISALIALSTTLAEALSQKGFDNLFIPVTTAAVLVLFHHYLVL